MTEIVRIAVETKAVELARVIHVFQVTQLMYEYGVEKMGRKRAQMLGKCQYPA